MCWDAGRARVGDDIEHEAAPSSTGPRSHTWACLQRPDSLATGNPPLEMPRRMAMADPWVGPTASDNSTLREVNLALTVALATLLFAWSWILGRLR